MKYKAIVAVDMNWAIGYKNELLFKVKKDMEYFRKMTKGKTVVMGRNTYESIRNMTPESKPVLPGRKKIVLTSSTHEHTDFNWYMDKRDTTIFINSIDSLQYYCAEDEDVWVIGGSSIYEQLYDRTDQIYVTRFMKSAENADTYFRDVTKDSNFKLEISNFIFGEDISLCFEKYVRK